MPVVTVKEENPDRSAEEIAHDEARWRIYDRIDFSVNGKEGWTGVRCVCNGSEGVFQNGSGMNPVRFRTGDWGR